MASLLFNFPFSLKTRIPEKLVWSSGILYKGDIRVNSTQKGIEMFMMLKRKTCPGLYEDILNSCKALSSKNGGWSLFFSDQLIIFSHFKVSWVDPELRLGAEFFHVAVTAGNLTSVCKQQPLLSCYPEKRKSWPHYGRSRPPVIYGLLMDDIVKMRRNSCGKF